MRFNIYIHIFAAYVIVVLVHLPIDVMSATSNLSCPALFSTLGENHHGVLHGTIHDVIHDAKFSDPIKRVELGAPTLATRKASCYASCWIDANLNRIEISAFEKTGSRIQLSSAHLIMNDLLLQAENISNFHVSGSAQFMQSAYSPDFVELIQRVGFVPDEVFPHRDTIESWVNLHELPDFHDLCHSIS
jgi:hypothetical protein